MAAERAPVYLLSSERSGTNLLRRRLTEHQRIYYGPQAAHFLKHLFFQAPYYGDLAQPQTFGRMIGDALDLCYLHFSPWDVTYTVEQVQQLYAQRYPQPDPVLLAHLLMSEYAAAKGYQSYFCKDNYLYEFYPFIRARLPQAKFIYLHRDARDFTVSQLQRPAARAGVKQIATLWAYEQSKCITAQAELEAEGKCIKLSYEELIADEERHIRRVCDFLEVEYSAKKEAPREKMVEGAHDWKNLSKATDSENRGKYRNALRPWQIKMVEAICRKQMQHLGYAPDYQMQPRAMRWYRVLDLLQRLMKIVRTELSRARVKDRGGELMRKRGQLLRRLALNYRTDH